MTPGRRDVAIALTLSGSAALYYSSYIFRFPTTLSDESYLYYVAWAFRDGLRPYEDIRLHSYLPGLFYLFSGLFEIFGDSVRHARVLMLVGLSLTPGLAFLAARYFTGPLLAFLGVLPLLLVPGPWHKFYVGAINAGFMCCGLSLIAQSSRMAATAFGLLLGIAFTVRIDAALAGTVLLFAALWLERWSGGSGGGRLIGSALFGVIAAALPVQLLLASQGVLTSYYKQVLNFPLDIFRQMVFTEGPARPPIANLVVWGGGTAEAWLLYGSLVPIGFVAVLAMRKRSSTWIFVAMGAVMNLPQYIMERPDPEHLTQHGVAILLPFTMLTGEALHRSGRWFAGAAMALFIGYGSLYAGKHLLRHQCGTPPAQAAEWRVLSNGLALLDQPGGSTHAMLEYALEHSPPGSRLAGWPFYPGVNFFTQRHIPGKQVFLVPKVITRAIEDEILADLRRRDVRFVFYAPGDRIHGHERSAPERFVPELHAFLMGAYEEVARFGNIWVLRRRKL